MPEPSGGLDAVHELIAADAMDRLADELLRIALSAADLVAVVLMWDYHGLSDAERQREVVVEARRFKAAGHRDPFVVYRSLELLTLMERLSIPQRERLAAAFYMAYERRDDELGDIDLPVRYTLDLLGLVCGLPDSGSLTVTRRQLLESMDRKSQTWQPWYSEMSQIEIDAGRPLPPAVVAVIRRSVIRRVRRDGLARQLGDPLLNVGEEWPTGP